MEGRLPHSGSNDQRTGRLLILVGASEMLMFKRTTLLWSAGGLCALLVTIGLMALLSRGGDFGSSASVSPIAALNAEFPVVSNYVTMGRFVIAGTEVEPKSERVLLVPKDQAFRVEGVIRPGDLMPGLSRMSAYWERDAGDTGTLVVSSGRMNPKDPEVTPFIVVYRQDAGTGPVPIQQQIMQNRLVPGRPSEHELRHDVQPLKDPGRYVVEVALQTNVQTLKQLATTHPQESPISGRWPGVPVFRVEVESK